MARALDNPTTVPTAGVCLVLPFLANGLSKLISWHAGNCADRTASQTFAETAEH